MRRTTTRRWIIVGVVFCAAALGAYAARRAVYGVRPAYVNVRWAPSVDAGTRQEREHRYGLTHAEPRDARTWSYLLVDVSRDNIRSLVLDPAVEDTHQIHRTAFRPWRTAPRGPYGGPGPTWGGTALDWITYFLVALGGLALALAALTVVNLPRALQRPFDALIQTLLGPRVLVGSALHRVLRWIETRIPEASPPAAALFRIVFGVSLLAFFSKYQVNAQWVATATAASGFQRLALSAFETFPAVVDWMAPWLMFWAILFAVGALTRVSFSMFALGAVAWGTVYTTRIDSHAVAAPLVAFLCLMWSRWGDVWSVDAWRARRRGSAVEPQPARVYGYTLWIPGVVIGTALAAAAVAKLRESGLGWITNGTVKYHFLSDAYQAPVDWGLQLARYAPAAVALSFAAVAIEALIIVGVFAGKYRYRAMAGIATFALFAGFWLFQGILWPLWAIMLLSFLPWHKMPRVAPTPAVSATTSPPQGALVMAQARVVAVLIVIQVLVSALNGEYPPLASTWGMYATTYASPADYESKAGLTYVAVAGLSDGRRTFCDLAPDEATAVLEAAAPQSTRIIQKCFGSTAIETIAVESRRRPVDWSRWQFADEVTVSVSEPQSVPRQ